MKQIIRKGIRDIIVDEVPDPVALPHHVLIRPVFSLISSGTETASIHQEGVIREVADNPSHLRKVWEVVKVNGPIRTMREVAAKLTSEYAVLGYSGAGILVEKHPTVAGFEPGDRVAYGGEGTGHGETILTGRNLVARVPDDVPFEQACFATLGSIAMNAVRISQCGLGDTVAVIGLGLVGQLAAQLARLQGAVVIGIDLKADRVSRARQCGAHYAFEAEAAAEAVGAITDGRGVDCVIIAAAAKSPAPCRQAIQICRDRGRIVVLGAVDMTLPWNDMYMKEIQLLMSRAYGPGSYDAEFEKKGRDYPLPYVRWTETRNMEEVLRLISTGRLLVDPLITHRFSLEEGARAYETIMNPAAGSLAVLLRYEPASAAVPVFQPQRRVETAHPGVAPASGLLGVALLGGSNIARWSHLPALKKAGGARLLAVYSSSGVRAKGYASRFGADFCATDYEEVLRHPGIDAVLITTRNQYHASQAVAALRAGKHVFVEKPMAITEQECLDLERAVAETGKILTVGFNRRFAPYYRRFREELMRRSGPALLNCRINSPGISGSYWMADPAIGGAILGEACHFIDLMRWMLNAELVNVSAFSLPTGAKDPIGENNLAASFLFSDGSVGNLTYCTVGSKTSGGERVEAFAPGLGLKIQDFKTLTIERGIRRSAKRFWAEKGYDAQMKEFIEAIRASRQPAVTVFDGSQATIGCLRMLESARTQMPVAIPDPAAARATPV
ncbi:MAG: bi-domain-containing oxidoreductase [Bryobacteraceae bacterium]|jgi:predicted dehydrogenase